MKIATLGPVIGTMTQDRATAVGGTLGAGPARARGERHARRRSARPNAASSSSCCTIQTLTPLFAYVAVLNALVAYERQTGALIDRRHAARCRSAPTATVDDRRRLLRRRRARARPPAAIAAPIGVGRDERVPAGAARDGSTCSSASSERQESTTIERVWLDTTRPKLGATHTLQVLLRDYRGAHRDRVDAGRRCRRRPAAR